MPVLTPAPSVSPEISDLFLYRVIVFWSHFLPPTYCHITPVFFVVFFPFPFYLLSIFFCSPPHFSWPMFRWQMEPWWHHSGKDDWDWQAHCVRTQWACTPLMSHGDKRTGTPASGREMLYGLSQCRRSYCWLFFSSFFACGPKNATHFIAI